MAELLSFKDNKDKANLLVLTFLAIFTSLALIWLYISGSAPTKKGELADPDGYMRLIRVSELYQTGQWYDTLCQRSNAPYGESLHWTRPFDILLLSGAIPLSLVIDFESALFWWGVIISPALICITLFALHWSVKPILSKDGPFLIVLVFAVQPIILSYYQAGRPDHHSLLIFLFVLSIGFTLRMVLRPFKMLLCYTAGAISALAMWVSVESLLPMCIILGVLGLFWVLENSDFPRKSLHYSLALLITIVAGLLIERPWYDLTTVEFDRLSAVHFNLVGFISLFWIVISIFNRHTSFFQRWANRLSFSLAGLAVIAFAMLVCFPKFYKGPFTDIDPRIIPIWITKVNEVQPLLSKSVSLALSVPSVGMAIFGFSFLLYLLSQETEAAKRKGWIYILLSIVIFVLVSLYQIRWSVYSQVLLSIVMTELMCRVLMRLSGKRRILWQALKRILVILIFSVGFSVAGFLADKVIKTEEFARSSQKTSLVPLCKYLNQIQNQREETLRILTHIDFGPEILYRTKSEVIATPYHRNGRGMIDTYNIMTSDTDEKAFRLIKKRKINLILLCPKSGESAFYKKSQEKLTFYQRLLQNKIPSWLQKVELPDDLSFSFSLFEVIYD